MLHQISSSTTNSSPSTTESVVEKMSRDLTGYLIETGSLPKDVDAVWPATPLQQSMFSEMIKSNYERYFNFETFKLGKDVNLQRLKAAVEHVYSTNSILQTSFVAVDDPKSSVSFAQIIHKHRLHFTQSSGDRRAEELLEHIKRDRIKAATQGALFQVHFETTRGDHFMVIAISHALYDGSSIRLLHKSIRDAYNETYTTNRDFRPFLEEVFRSTTEEAKTFWKSTLWKLPETRFPRTQLTDIQGPTIVHRTQKQSRISLTNVEDLCRSLRITLQTLGQTCWTFVLAHLMGQLDVVFGAVLSCRNIEEADEVMFPLMNTVAVRSVLHGNLSEMLSYMQDMSDTTRQYQHFSLGTAQAYALASKDAESAGSDTTLFDSLFIYQGRRSSAKEDELYESVSGTAEVEFPVCVEMEIIDDHLIWTIACKSVVRTAEETGEIMKMLDTVLERIISAPQASSLIADGHGISVCGLPEFPNPGRLPQKSESTRKDSLEEAWTDTELSIRKALHELSNAPEDQIRKDLTIFHLGLDSILVLKLPPLLRKHGVKLGISDILKAQTITAMSELARLEAVEVQPLDIDEILAASIAGFDLAAAINDLDIGEVQYSMQITAGQLYMIRMWQVSQGVLFYPTFAYTMDRELDKVRLENAWRELLKRHDILRTGFFEHGSGMVQVVFNNSQNKVEYYTDSKAAVQNSPSDMRKPPLKLVIIESEGQHARIGLHIHHALYDGISLPILIAELQALYLGEPLEAPESNFGNFVARSINASKRPSRHKDKTLAQEGWTHYLGPRDSIETSTSTPIITNVNNRTEIFRPIIPIGSLKPVAQASGVTIDALLLATISRSHAATFAMKPTQIIIGIYLANRTLAPTLAAPTLNLLPLRIQDPLSRPIREIAADIQRDLQLIGSDDMSSVSLADIYSWTGVRVDFFVNILKDAISSTAGSNEEHIFIPVEHGGISPIDYEFERNIDVNTLNHERHAAYLPSIDVEIRYRGDEKEGEIDIGIFAPAEKLDEQAAQHVLDSFVEECRTGLN